MIKKLSLYICTIIVTLIVFGGATSLFNNEVPYIRSFFVLSGDYGLLREDNHLANLALQVKAIIPRESCVESSFSEKDSVLSKVTFKYYLYPLKVIDSFETQYNKSHVLCQDHYLIDFNHRVLNPSLYSKAIGLSHGARVLLSKDAKLNPSLTTERYSQVSVLKGFLLFNLIVLVVGCFMICAFFPKGRILSVGVNLSSSYLLGFILVTLMFLLFSLQGILLTPGFVCVLLYSLLFISYFFMRHRGGSLVNFFKTTNKPSFDMIVSLIGYSFLFFYVVCIVSYPVGITDEVNIWLLKAKMFFYSHGLIFDYTELTNNYYPLLWPLNIALQYIFVGGDYDEISKWTSAIIFISLLGQMRFLAHLLGFDRKISWLSILFFMVCFHHWTFFTALPENVYIAVMIFAISFFIDWLITQKKQSLALALIGLSGLCAIKFEGFIVTIFVIISFLFSEKLTKTNFLEKLRSVLLIGAPLLIHILWILWLKLKNVPYLVFHLQNPFLFKNVVILFQMLLYFINNDETKLIIIAAVLIPLLFRNKWPWTQVERFLIIFSGCLMLFAFSAGLRWSEMDFRLYYPEVLTRLCSRAMPFVILLWLSRLQGARIQDGHNLK